MTKSGQDFFPSSVLHDLSAPKQMVLNPSGSNTLLFYSKYSNSPLYYSEMKFIDNVTYLNTLSYKWGEVKGGILL